MKPVSSLPGFLKRFGVPLAPYEKTRASERRLHVARLTHFFMFCVRLFTELPSTLPVKDAVSGQEFCGQLSTRGWFSFRVADYARGVDAVRLPSYAPFVAPEVVSITSVLRCFS